MKKINKKRLHMTNKDDKHNKYKKYKGPWRLL